MDKRTNTDLQNITKKTKDRVTRTPLKTGGELKSSVRVSSSCSTSGTRRVISESSIEAPSSYYLWWCCVVVPEVIACACATGSCITGNNVIGSCITGSCITGNDVTGHEREIIPRNFPPRFSRNSSRV